MMTLDDPRYVGYEQYVAEGHYLRFHVVFVAAKPDWLPHAEYYDFSDMIVEWLRDNAKKRFSTKHWAYVCFEDRQDAMMFKLAFG